MSSLVSFAALADGSSLASTPAPIPWDLALINGLEASSEPLGIRDRVQVVALGTSGCTPRVATLITINPESGARQEAKVAVQGRSVQFEIEDTVRPQALLRIECLERGVDGSPSRIFTLALDARTSKGMR